MTTAHRVETWEFLTKGAYALSSYALTCVALNDQVTSYVICGDCSNHVRKGSGGTSGNSSELIDPDHELLTTPATPRRETGAQDPTKHMLRKEAVKAESCDAFECRII